MVEDSHLMFPGFFVYLPLRALYKGYNKRPTTVVKGAMTREGKTYIHCGIMMS